MVLSMLVPWEVKDRGLPTPVISVQTSMVKVQQFVLHAVLHAVCVSALYCVDDLQIAVA